MTLDSTGAVEVFYSYAHEDEHLCKELEKHLSLLKWQGRIAGWYDRSISAGTEWAHEIDAHLNAAQIILLLISADFLASEYCYSIEMKRALERHNTGEARVIPIILRSVYWKDALFGNLQVLPTDGKPVASSYWHNLDEAFANVAEGISIAVRELTSNRTQGSSSSQRVWNVPYRRNPFFTGQESIIKHLHDTLRAGKAAALTQPQAISGLGGIGKTQIAIEYAYRYRDVYHAVFWAKADSRELLVSDFVSLANLLQLPEKDAKDQSITVDAVKHWLEVHADWLLILDNADDLVAVHDFLPVEGSGHILLTTRAQAMGTIAQGIKVEQMEPEEGALFLLRRANNIASDASLNEASVADRATAKEISQLLDGLPLALDQAGAYIEETVCGLSGYLERYHTQRAMLLKRRGSLPADHPEPVATTWSLSLEKVEQANPASVGLLHLCAFLYPDAIPEEIIAKAVPDLGLLFQSVSKAPFYKSIRRSFRHIFQRHIQPTAVDLFTFDAAIEALGKYSLIRRNADTQTLSIHRLVQAVLKDGMGADMQRQWAGLAVRAVNRTFPDVEVANWSRCQRHLLQARECAALIEHWNMGSPEAARLLNQTGVYLYERAQYTEAEPLLQRALAICEQVLGPNHPYTATGFNNLALLYRTRGKYDQAEPLYQRALAIREQVLGPNHPDTATSLNSLALLYDAQGKYDQAESLYQRALAIREQVLGPNHPHTATSLNSLALFYDTQGQYDQAEPLYQRALVICEQVLGPNHPDTATSLNNLALLYDAQGKYDQAKPLFHRALAIREQILGPDHPNVAQSLNNLALLYNSQEEYDQAEPLYRQALSTCEQVLGPNHPHVATVLNNLAGLYRTQGEYDQAEPLYQRALLICERALRPDHPDTANVLENYANLLRRMKRDTEATKLEARAQAIRAQSPH